MKHFVRAVASTLAAVVCLAVGCPVALASGQTSTATPIGTLRLEIPAGWVEVHRTGTTLAYRVKPHSTATIVMDRGTVASTLASLLSQSEPRGARRSRLLSHSTHASGLSVAERAWKISPRRGQAFYLFLIALSKSGHRTVVLLTFRTPAADLTASEPAFLSWIQSLSVLPRFQGTPWSAPDLGISLLLPTGWEAFGVPGKVVAAPSAAALFDHRVEILALSADISPQAALAGPLASAVAPLGAMVAPGPITSSGHGWVRTFKIQGGTLLSGWAVAATVGGRTLLGVLVEPPGTLAAVAAADRKILAHVTVTAPRGPQPYREFLARSGAFTAQVPARSGLLQGVSMTRAPGVFPTIGLYAQDRTQGLVLLEGGPAVYDATGVRADLPPAQRAAALPYLPGAQALLSPILATGWGATGHPLEGVHVVVQGPVQAEHPAPGVVVERSRILFTAVAHGVPVHGLASGETVRMTTGQRVGGHRLWMWRVVRLAAVIVPQSAHVLPTVGPLETFAAGFAPTASFLGGVRSRGMTLAKRLGRVTLELMGRAAAPPVGFDGIPGKRSPAFPVHWK